MTTVFEQKLSIETENLLIDYNDDNEEQQQVATKGKDNNIDYDRKSDLKQDFLESSDCDNKINNIANDSGVEDYDESASSCRHNAKHEVKEKKLKRRPSLWRLFRSSTIIKNKQKTKLNAQSVVDGNNKGETMGKEKLHRTASCPAIHPNGLQENGHDSSQTSDLGDSIHSTPVSSISSRGFIEIPGLIGMHNLGNTCYFNAILQCLSHIDIFSEYFAMDHFLKDLNKVGKSPPHYIGKRNNKHSGKLTYVISLIIKSIWNGDFYSLDLLQDVMNVISAHNNQCNMFEQQDALEFFMWLIDKIHEELVKLPKKKCKELKKKKFQCNEEQAVAAFASFTQYSQSYIQGLFLSQYQSTIPCFNCQRHSSTFDPYTSLSLDIPPQPKIVVFVTVAYAAPNTQPTKYGFYMQRKATIHELKTELTDQTGIHHFLLVEINSCGMRRILLDDNPLSILPKIEDSIYAIECIKDDMKSVQNEAGENDFLLVVSNVERWGRENRRFGLPIIVNVSSKFSFKQIQSELRKQMAEDVRNSLVKVIKEKQVRLGLRVVSDRDKALYLNNELECPLADDKIVTVYNDALQMNCLYLVAEWEPINSGWFMNSHRYPISLDDVSCAEMRMRQQQPFAVNLEDCLRLQTQEEKLPKDDVWKCPFCRTEQKGITKKLTLWSLPDILVLHLKRFDQVQQFNGKVTTLVRFPRTGLNLSPYVATATNTINERYRKESMKLQYQPPPQTEEDCIYDLRAVCNHLGSHLNRGHYTSYCQNSLNGLWYLYDDRFVRCVSEDQVETSGAYILFYERRKLSSRIPDILSLSKKNKKVLEHWSLQLKSSTTSKQPEVTQTGDVDNNNNVKNESSLVHSSLPLDPKQDLSPMFHVVKREDDEEY